MLFYIFLFSTTTLLGFIYDSLDSQGSISHRKEAQKSIILAIIYSIYVVIVGCKGYNVGSDTYAYISKLESATGTTLYEYLSNTLFIEPIFNSFVWVCAWITKSSSLFFIIFSLIFFYIFLKFIVKYTTSMGWSIWILNSMGFPVFALSTVRQCLAISICILSYMYLEKSKVKSWTLVIIALLTHLSSFIYLPMMFINYINKKNIIRSTIILLLVTTFFGAFFMRRAALYYAATTGKYESDSLTGEGVGGFGMIAFLVVLLYLGYKTYFPRKDNIPLSYYNEFIAISFALVVFIISRVNIATIRLYWYYLAFSIIYIPNVLSHIRKDQRRIWQFAIIAITFYYLTTNVMSSPYEESKLLLPYYFFWD